MNPKLADFVGKKVELIIAGGYVLGNLIPDEYNESDLPAYIFYVCGGYGQIYLNEMNTKFNPEYPDKIYYRY